MSEAKEKTSLQLVLRSLSPVVGTIGMTYTDQHEDTWGGQGPSLTVCLLHTCKHFSQPSLRLRTYKLQTNTVSAQTAVLSWRKLFLKKLEKKKNLISSQQLVMKVESTPLVIKCLLKHEIKMKYNFYAAHPHLHSSNNLNKINKRLVCAQIG